VSLTRFFNASAVLKEIINLQLQISETHNRLVNVIKLRGTLKDLCIENDAGVFFSAKKGLTATPKSAAAFATDCF